MPPTVIAGSASTEADLNAALVAAAGETTAGTYEIDLGGDTTETTALKAVDLRLGVSLVINGQGHTLDGGGAGPARRLVGKHLLGVTWPMCGQTAEAPQLPGALEIRYITVSSLSACAYQEASPL